jgi:uncharacterized membrane protein YheB (UPF0754 family)
MNKNIITNIAALLCIWIGYTFTYPLLLTIGLFSFSGAVTNWLAIYMLFEKVPGLYGSGIIPLRFLEFKEAIKKMMMKEFFTQEHIHRFIQTSDTVFEQLSPVIQQIDFSPAFEKLIHVIMESSFGNMLDMMGGEAALRPLKPSFTSKMKEALIEMIEKDSFKRLVAEELNTHNSAQMIQDKITQMIDQRLNELTPESVKLIVQEMIKAHLGWLVVWGAVFGALIGAITHFIV